MASKGSTSPTGGTNSHAKGSASTEDSKVLTATLRTCIGCQLKKSPHVKEFIELDLPQFDNLTLEYKAMQAPVALFHDKDGQVLESVSLVGKSRQECNQLFVNKGFSKKKNQSPSKI